MVPTLKKFMAAHGLDDVTIVADSGMIWDANMRAIEAQGLSFILGMKTPDVPYVVKQWRQNHSRPGDPPSARSIPAPAGPILVDLRFPCNKNPFSFSREDLSTVCTVAEPTPFLSWNARGR